MKTYFSNFSQVHETIFERVEKLTAHCSSKNKSITPQTTPTHVQSALILRNRVVWQSFVDVRKLLLDSVIFRAIILIKRQVRDNDRFLKFEKGNTEGSRMDSKSLQTLAEEYFYSMNSIAQKIGEDVASTKEAYEGLWSTLSLKEQNQAIDETIIQPEVALKYMTKKADCAKDLEYYYPRLKIQTGMKYLIDESGSVKFWILLGLIKNFGLFNWVWEMNIKRWFKLPIDTKLKIFCFFENQLLSIL